MSRKLFSIIVCVIAMLAGLALTFVSVLCGYNEANGIFIWPALLGVIVFWLFLNMLTEIVDNDEVV